MTNYEYKVIVARRDVESYVYECQERYLARMKGKGFLTSYVLESAQQRQYSVVAYLKGLKEFQLLNTISVKKEIASIYHVK
jgi:ribosomal protein S8